MIREINAASMAKQAPRTSAWKSNDAAQYIQGLATMKKRPSPANFQAPRPGRSAATSHIHTNATASAVTMAAS